MTMTRQAVASQAGMLQNLGNQIRQDVTTLMARRQMQGLAEGLQSVDTTSPQFGRQVAGLFAQYPLAAQSPLGQAAISQLGAEFKLNQQIAAEDRRFGNQLGGYAAKDFIENRPYGSPVTAQGLYSVATGGGVQPEPGGANVYQPTGTLQPVQPAQPGEQPLFDVTDTVSVDIPAAQPQAAPVPPVSSVGAQIQAYDQQLRQQRVPQHLAEGMLRSYAQSLTAQQRPGSRRIESTDQGLMQIGPDGVARPVTTADGSALRRASGGNIENTTADNRRADASMRLREAGDLDSRANRVMKQMDQTGIGAPGPFQKNGKWYSHTDKGEKEVTATMAQRWLDLNHEYTQLRQEAQRANEAYRALATPASEQPAAPLQQPTAGAPARMKYTGGQLILPQ